MSHAGRELKLRVGPWCTPDRDRHLRAPVAEGPHGPRPLRGLRVSHVLLIRVPTFPPARRRLPPWLLLPPRGSANVPQDGARLCLPHRLLPRRALVGRRPGAHAGGTPGLRTARRRRHRADRRPAARPRGPHLGAARRAGWQRGMADRLAAGHRYRLARPRRLGRRLHDRLGRADGELAGRPAAHRRLADAGTDRRRGPGTPVAGRAGPRLRTAPRARGAQRVPGPAGGVRARLPPAPAADPPLQPQRPDPASGAGGTPGGLAVSDPNTETTGTPDTGPDRARGIDDLLEQVRAGYTRVGPQAAHEAARAGEALLVDIRYAALRERDGLIPGAVVVERNELE